MCLCASVFVLDLFSIVSSLVNSSWYYYCTYSLNILYLWFDCRFLPGKEKGCWFVQKIRPVIGRLGAIQDTSFASSKLNISLRTSKPNKRHCTHFENLPKDFYIETPHRNAFSCSSMSLLEFMVVHLTPPDSPHSLLLKTSPWRTLLCNFDFQKVGCGLVKSV